MIDLFSDTLTKPSPAMRHAMAEAEVGDEQKREDPTTNRLQQRVAELLGKPAAVFLPSGAMCNQIALRVHCRQGDEAVIDRSYHIVNFEVGGAAALSGVQLRTIDGERGMFSVDDLKAAIRPRGTLHLPLTKLLCLEQTTNMGGGGVWPFEQFRAVSDAARDAGLAVHLDGARLMNAVVASGVPASEWAACCDSLWIDFSKGLGAPVGGVLAGSAEFIAESWRFKHQFGGALRQSGILAAACIHALDHHIDRLADDHANARALYQGLSAIPGIRAEEPETNMVFFHVDGLGMDAAGFIAAATQAGVRFSPGAGPARVRAVTHLDVDAADIAKALEIVGDLAAARV